DMASLAPSETAHHIAVLSKLYSEYQEYPSQPHINELEVKKLRTKPSGSGGFGDCWEGMFLGHLKVAMKCTRGDIDENEARRKLEREMHIWKNLRHPHVLRFVGLATLGNTTYMLSPWMDNGTALSYLQGDPDGDCLKILLQIAEGIQYLHNFNPVVVHGDLKGANVFISKAGDALLADFGLSEMVSEGDDLNNSTAFYAAGTRRWQAPELVNAVTAADAQRTPASDIFAFGRIMTEVERYIFPNPSSQLFTLQVPFPETSNEVELAKKIAAGEVPRRPKDPFVLSKGLSKPLWELVKECCRFQPSQRPKADEVVRRLRIALEARNTAAGAAGLDDSHMRRFSLRTTARRVFKAVSC
ncbi:hypothetical protein BOTBODRAFT_114301, partial [Botryobasidium botryosum FD-172 SS1]